MLALPEEAGKALDAIRHADIVIGIPSYNNARTIGHVVRAAHAGLAKYFPQFTGVIVNSDGGSRDETREAVLSAKVEDAHMLMLSTPLLGVHRVSFPYHGIPGKGSAFRLIFQMADALGAKACAVVDSDLRSITPEWIDLLVRPVLHAGFDFVAPYYHRHKYDGTITNSIVYPLTRALYGRRIRQPIGGDFGMSGNIISRYLRRDDWETDVARYGIDIWMTTIAVAERFRVCQSFLGAKLHDAKDPGADLSSMLHQVVGSVFALMGEYEAVWLGQADSQDVDLFGFRYDVGLDPIEVNTERMFKGTEGNLGACFAAANHGRDPEPRCKSAGTSFPVGRRPLGARHLRVRHRLSPQVIGPRAPAAFPDAALPGARGLVRDRDSEHVCGPSGGENRAVVPALRRTQALSRWLVVRWAIFGIEAPNRVCKRRERQGVACGIGG